MSYNDNGSAPPEIDRRIYRPNRFIPKNGGSLTLTVAFFGPIDKQWYVNQIGGEARAETLIADYRVNITAKGSYSRGSGDHDITIKDRTWFTLRKVIEDEGEETTYTVTYYGNGEDSGIVPVDGTDYQENDTVIVLGNNGGLARSGFSFIGWNTQANGSGTSYTGGQTFTMETADVDLYAIWQSE
jgi:uncharacterized repeat protein (TIGR02543 family)